LKLARKDERTNDGLPLLFRVDAETGVPGGLRYLEDCGGGRQCYPAEGLTCLGHLGSKRRGSAWDFGRRDTRYDNSRDEWGFGGDGTSGI
jgi:hypothetical protein